MINVTDNFEAASLDAMWILSAPSAYGLATDKAQAGAKSLKYQYPASSLQMALWDATDANEGDVEFSADVLWDGGSDSVIAVFVARRTASNTPFTSSSHYELNIYPRSSTMCFFKRRVEGTSAYVGNANGYVSKSAFSNNAWYRFTFRVWGDGPVTLGLMVQRHSDGYYLQANGSSWGASAYVITAEDSSGYLRGRGYAGFASYIPVGSNDRIWYDNVSISGLVVEKLKTSVQTVVADSEVHSIPVTGQLTSWSVGAGASGSPQFTVSGGNASLVGQSISSETEAVLYVNTGSQSGSLTLTDPSTGKTRTVELIAPSQSVAYDDDALYYSPNNWRDTGSGRESVNPGSYVRLRVTGTTFLRMAVDKSLYAAIADSDCPLVVARTAKGSWSETALDCSTELYTLLSGLDAGQTYDVEVVLRSLNINNSVWGGANGLCVTEWQVSEGGSVLSPVVKAKRAIYYGDSTSYGISSIENATGAIRSRHDARFSPGYFLTHMMDLEVGIIGFGSQGYSKSGAGGVPAAGSAWGLYSDGHSRLVDGSFLDGVDYVFLRHGTADYTGSATGSAVQSAAQAMVAAVRQAAPSALLFLCIPAGGHYRTELTAVWNALKGSDSKLYLLDARLDIEAALASYSVGKNAWTIDGIHYRENAAAVYAGALARMTQDIVEEPVADAETVVATGYVFEVVAGGDAPSYGIELRYSDGGIPNLVGAEILFSMRRRYQSSWQVEDGVMTLLDKAAGRVVYQWGENDLAVAGRYEVTVKANLADGKSVCFAAVPVLVRG